jgi:hypothetical protein
LKKLLIILFVFVSLPVWAVSEKEVTGYVRTELGELMPYVDVYTADNKTFAVTDADGKFSLTTQQDTITLFFSHLGYLKEKLFIKFYNAPQRFVNVVLKEETQGLSDILVHGEKLQYTTAQTVDLTNLSVLPQATGGGIESLIKTFQGVSSNNELSSQYSVRGGSYDENSVYVNGIEVYRPYLVRNGEQEGLSFVNPDMTGSVDFSAGGFDALHGDKLSSVLNIEYRKPYRFEAGVGASFTGATAYVGSSNEKYSQMHGFRYKNSSFILGTLQTKAEYNPNFFDYQTYITYKPHEKVELSFLGNISQNTYNFIPETRSTTFGSLNDIQNFTIYFDGQEKDVFRTFFGALSAKYQVNDKLNLGLTVSSFYADERVSYDIEGEYWLNKVASMDGSNSQQTGVGNYYEHARNTMSSVVAKVAHDGVYSFNKNNDLKWGVEYVYEKVNESVNEWEMRDSSGYSIPYSPDVNLYYKITSQNHLSESKIRAYVQDTYRWHLNKGGMLSFTGGVRLNYWTFNNELTVSPRVVIAYFPDIKPDIRFRFATGLYYQSPTYKEIKDTVTIGGYHTNYLNREIRSQSSLQFIAGMDYYYRVWNRPFKLTAEVFYKHLNNIIPYTLDNVSINYMGKNCAHGYAAGFDVKLFGEVVPGVDSWLSFSLIRTMEDIDGDGHGFIPRPTDQLYNVSLFFQDYIPGIPQYRIHVLFNWAQGLPTGPPRSSKYIASSARMPDYRRVDIGLSRKFEKGKDAWMGRGFFKPFREILVAFEVLNLFGFNNVNSYYWVTDIYNIQYAVPNYLTGRQFNLKLQLKF